MNWEKKQMFAWKGFIQGLAKNRALNARKILGLEPMPLVEKPKKMFWIAPLGSGEPWSEDAYGNLMPRSQIKESTPLKSAREYGKWLEKKGFKRLGDGAFSTVYGKPKSDRVIKVTRNPDNWIDYVVWGAQKGFAGTYVPKVFSYKSHEEESKFTVAVVERMQETVGSSYSNDNFVVYELFQNYVIYDNLLAGVFLEEVYPGLATFGKELQEKFDGLDVHSGNFMTRPDGSFCITDPVSSHREPTYKRLKAKDFTSLANAIALDYIIGYKGWHESSYRY